MNNDMTNKFFLPAAVIVAGILIAGAVLWSGAHPAQAPSGTGAAAPSVNIKDVKTAGNPSLGSATAPVTIAFWSDYQCPYCKAFEVGDQPQIPTAPAMPQIIANYVNTGKVRIVFMDFPFLGPDSQVDAEYARSVWALYPKQFMDWRTALYKQEPQENSMDASQNLAFLKKVTDGISGMDFAKLTADVAKNKTAYDAAIAAAKAEGEKAGINATPSFVIGTKLIQGAYPYAEFQSAIDAALAAAGK